MSATWLVSDIHRQTPNAAARIARNLVEKGTYEGGHWGMLKGVYSDPRESPPKMFQLPGEALYLAFWFRLLPEGLHRYVHVPVTVLLVTSVASVACVIGGSSFGLFVGLFASVQPFIVIHGPVWDDTFLAAALVWAVIALLLSRLSISNHKLVKPMYGLHHFIIAAAVAFASITRGEAQLIFLVIAATMIFAPSLKRLRLEGTVIALAVMLAVGAWGFRNALVVGEFAISSSRDGWVLYVSNGPHTRKALRYGQVDTMYMNVDTMRDHWNRTAGMTETETNRYYIREAVKYVKDHPFETVQTSLLKLGISLLGIKPEQPLWTSRNMTAISVNAALLTMSLGLLWLYKMRVLEQSYGSAAWFFAAIVTVVGIMLLFGPIGLRYRIALDGILWIASSTVILHGLRKTRVVTAKKLL